jgi:hypothetical protein
MEYDYYVIKYLSNGRIEEQICFSERLVDLYLKKYKYEGRKVIKIIPVSEKENKNNRKI